MSAVQPTAEDPRRRCDRLQGNLPHVEKIKEALTQPFDDDLAIADIESFASLHSWYKHLPAKSDDLTIDSHQGDAFYVVFCVGQQERNESCKIENEIDLHW